MINIHICGLCLPVAHFLLFPENTLHFQCVCMCVCAWESDIPKHTQSTVKYFLGYLPWGHGRDEWVKSSRDGQRERDRGRGRERERQRKPADQIKDEGAQLADSGQSTRTPTTRVSSGREELRRREGGEVRGGSGGGGYSEALKNRKLIQGGKDHASAYLKSEI